jgi:hypothetical protein
MASRTTITTIYKLNPYNFSDLVTLSLPDDDTIVGGITGDLQAYKDKIYILSSALVIHKLLGLWKYQTT